MLALQIPLKTNFSGSTPYFLYLAPNDAVSQRPPAPVPHIRHSMGWAAALLKVLPMTTTKQTQLLEPLFGTLSRNVLFS